MAISVNWLTKVFSVPQADLTLVSGTLYEMDTETYFRQGINAIMASEDGIVFDDPIDHNTEYTVVGVTYARKIEMINGYSYRYTPDSQWSVRLAGSNNNLFDVENGVLVQNQVQVIAQNSAGLVNPALTTAQDTKLDELHKLQGLDASNPLTVTPTSRAAGSVSQTITGDGKTTSTVTRS